MPFCGNWSRWNETLSKPNFNISENEAEIWFEMLIFFFKENIWKPSNTVLNHERKQMYFYIFFFYIKILKFQVF